DDRKMGHVEHLEMTIGQCLGRTLESVNGVHGILAASHEECGCLDPVHAMSERLALDQHGTNRD
ncbi:hypothetical protein RZS08_62995, partial [Arthrospira platensis SPKY1]|nr:hypothetical protein [Arthrospira platensis SPKY1]